jgi:hypothetical protein
VGLCHEGVETGVCVADGEAVRHESGVEFLVPCARGLLESVQALLEPSDHVLLAWLDHAFWNGHADLFFHIAVEEHRLDVELVALEIVEKGERHHDAEIVAMMDRCESLVVVEAFNLSVALGNDAGFAVGRIGRLYAKPIV